MKYACSWTVRASGSATENIADAKKLQEVFAAWEPPEGATYMHLASVTGGKGYTLIETDDPKKVAESVTLFSPFLEWTVDPVIEIEDAVALGAAALAKLT